jgi:hypothetical protein
LNEVADGAFHNAPGGTRAEKDELLRIKQLLQLRLNLGVKVFESLSPMSDHRRTKRLKRFIADLDRPRDIQLNVSHIQVREPSRSLPSWQLDFYPFGPNASREGVYPKKAACKYWLK